MPGFVMATDLHRDVAISVAVDVARRYGFGATKVTDHEFLVWRGSLGKSILLGPYAPYCRFRLSASEVDAGTEVTPVFSPTAADEDKRVAQVKFRLRTHERLTVWIQDSRGRKISTLLPPRSVRAGTKFDLLWDGFTGGGVIDPNGVYKPVVKLEHSHRTFLLPSPIQLDTA